MTPVAQRLPGPPAEGSSEGEGTAHPWLLRVSLFACVLERRRGLELLGGLAEPERTLGLRLGKRMLGLRSSDRQGRLALEFGLRDDASLRLGKVLGTLPGAFREEVLRRLPGPYRPALTPPEPGPLTASPLRALLAERLILEVFR